MLQGGAKQGMALLLSLAETAFTINEGMHPFANAKQEGNIFTRRKTVLHAHRTGIRKHVLMLNVQKITGGPQKVLYIGYVDGMEQEFS